MLGERNVGNDLSTRRISSPAMSLPSALIAVSGIAALLVTIGCRENATTVRVPLHGVVRVDGALVTEGSISLLPTGGNAGPAANTVIVDGSYRFSEETGPTAGAHRVVVGVSAIDNPSEDSGDVALSAPAAGVVPDGVGKQNPLGPRNSQRATSRQWEMRFDVPAEGDFRADFEFGTNRVPAASAMQE